MSKKSLRLIIFAAVVGGVGFFGYQYWQNMKSPLPKGIASGNGRIEAKLVDVAAKEALRVKEIRVDEGALVRPGEVLVVLDTATLEAQLAEAKLAVATTQEKLAVALAAITRRKAEIELAKIEVDRTCVRRPSLNPFECLSGSHQVRLPRVAETGAQSPARTEIPKIADQRLGRASLTPENVADSHTPGNNNTGK